MHERIRSTTVLLAGATVIPTMVAASAWAQTITFTKIADTDTPIPGGVGNFTGFGAITIDQGNVAFDARGSSGQGGVYTLIGGTLGVVADKNDAVPGGSGGTFLLIGGSWIDGTNVVFKGQGGGQDGIYTDVGGALNIVADRNTSVPGGMGNFFVTDTASMDEGNVVFRGFTGPFPRGIYKSVGGALSVVADVDMTVPGGVDFFTDPSLASISGADVAFRSGVDGGIFTDMGGALRVVADNNTPIPGGSGNFEGYGGTAIDDGVIAFAAIGSPPQVGHYMEIHGVLNVVADSNSPIPGGSGTFSAFGVTPSLDGTNIAFRAIGPGGQDGVYTNMGGSLIKVVDLSDSIEGKALAAVGPDAVGSLSAVALGLGGSLSGNEIAFIALFTDDSQGLFVATIADLCGNGVVEGSEICDDGNTFDNDGCSAACGHDAVIPTVSEWGLMVMSLLAVAIGAVLFSERAASGALNESAHR